MTKEFSQGTSSNLTNLILGVVGLTTLSLLNTAEPIKAASLGCGSGDNWVATCQSGIYEFGNMVTNNVNLFSPNNQPDFTATRFGNTSLLVGEPVDALIGDPLLGDVGSLDGILDVIKYEIFSSISTGQTPEGVRQTFSFGDGVPDFVPTPPNASLYSAGAIIQRQDNPALADSFFRAFIDVQGGEEGSLRNNEPVATTAVTPLTSFPSAVTYVSTNSIIPLFAAGSDGTFNTDDDIEIARLVPDANGRTATFSLTPASVPEPSTIIPLLLVGVGTIAKKVKENMELRASKKIWG